MMEKVKRLLELVMLRRMKDSPGVNLAIPPKEEILLFVPLTPTQRTWYTRLLTNMHDAVRRSPSAADESRAVITTSDMNTSDWKRLMNLLMQLRRICTSPYLLRNSSPTDFNYQEHVLNASSKFIMLDKIIKRTVLENGRKLLIFSEFTEVLDLVEEILDKRGANGGSFRYCRLDGSTGRARRNLNVKLFQDNHSPYKVFILTTRAGGLGLNLTSADSVVMIDHDWNPQVTLQAEARAHRIGQTKPVKIYKLCTVGTVEEQMLSRVQKKLYLSAKVTESMTDIHGVPEHESSSAPINGSRDEGIEQLDMGQLRRLIKLGTRALSREEIDAQDMQTWSFETMIEKCSMNNEPCPENDVEVNGLDTGVTAETEQQWLAGIEHVECAKFEGQRLKRIDTRSEPASALDLNRADRRKGKERTVMQNGWVVAKESTRCTDWEAVPTTSGRKSVAPEPGGRAKQKFAHEKVTSSLCSASRLS